MKKGTNILVGARGEMDPRLRGGDWHGEGGDGVVLAFSYQTQFSSLNPPTRSNSRILFVTSVRPWLRACPAIMRS